MEDSGESGIPLKIAVLGQTLVGKSALTFRFINDKFPNEHDTTIEDSYSFTAKIDGINCQLEILDTAKFCTKSIFSPNPIFFAYFSIIFVPILSAAFAK